MIVDEESVQSIKSLVNSGVSEVLVITGVEPDQSMISLVSPGVSDVEVSVIGAAVVTISVLLEISEVTCGVVPDIGMVVGVAVREPVVEMVVSKVVIVSIKSSLTIDLRLTTKGRIVLPTQSMRSPVIEGDSVVLGTVAVVVEENAISGVVPIV